MGADAGELRKGWEAATEGLGTPAARGEIFDQLCAAYTGPDRHYHGIGHIADCLREFDPVRAQATNARAVELAIWFHDVVYDGRRADNEQRSADAADAALQRLGGSATLRRDVADLILLTRHTQTPATVDGMLMIDIDLASLGIAPDAFDANGDAIRREYPHVADADFFRARINLLGRFLDRPRIYYTQVFFDRYERAARANLERTLLALR